MTDPGIRSFDALDADARVGDRGAGATITLLTASGPVVVSMRRAVIEQLYRCLERELQENPVPESDRNREIS
jgi:hypothetical protein